MKATLVSTGEPGSVDALQQELQEWKATAAARERLMAELCHELRSPLNVILGWADLLLAREGLLDERTSRGLGVIRRNAVLQARLITDYLELNRLGRGKLELAVVPTDCDALRAIVRAAVDGVDAEARAKRVQIEIVDRIDVGRSERFKVDSGRLQQAVWNLLSNAVKFSPEEGTVRVTLSSNSASIEIHVQDSGPGIEPALLSRLFDGFQQGRAGVSAQQGLGLGLHIVQGIVKLHGGSVRVENTTPGVRFTIALPRHRE